MTAQIAKITIDLGKGKTLELTEAQAKELKQVLDALYREPTVSAPVVYPYAPYVPWRYWGVVYSNGSTTGDVPVQPSYTISMLTQ